MGTVRHPPAQRRAAPRRARAVLSIVAGLAVGAVGSAAATTVAELEAVLDAADLDEIAALIVAGVEADPKRVAVLNDAARRFADAGRLDDARTALQAALASDGAYERVYRNLETVNRALALDAYRDALELPRVAEVDAALEPVEPPAARPDPASASASVVATANGSAIEPTTEPTREPIPESVPELEAPLDFVRSWASAWAAQDLEAYLAAYVDDYRDADAPDHRSWRARRSERVLGPDFIEVELSAIDIRRTGPAAAVVEFDQRYRSDSFADRTRKLLILDATQGAWRIHRELVVR